MLYALNDKVNKCLNKTYKDIRALYDCWYNLHLMRDVAYMYTLWYSPRNITTLFYYESVV